MRPYLELLISKTPNVNQNNLNKTQIFGGSKGLLNDRLMSFKFEESDGDDIERNRKGRKDVVSFTFIDKVPESEDFISDKKIIETNDLLFVRYGWVLENGQKILPDLTEREFKIVKIEPKFSNSMSTVTVTAYDRSIDLDRGAVSFMLDNQAPLGSLTPFKVVLQTIARTAGLTLDETSRVILQDDFQIGTKLAVPRETLASYLKFLAEDTGSLFFVENRRLFFGARKIPDSKHISLKLVRGRGISFDPKQRDDMRTTPIVDLNIERKISTDGLKFTVVSQGKRSSDISTEATIASELDKILLIVQSGDEPLNRVPFKIFPPLIEVPTEKGESSLAKTDKLEQELSVQDQLTTFFKDPHIFKDKEVFSAIRQPTPALRDQALKNLAKQKLADLVMREISATVKIYGNPIVRHGQLVTLAGDMPNVYKGNWYVQSVEHSIDASNYFTTLKLMAASPDNPLLKDKLKAFGKKLVGQPAHKPPKRTIVDVQTDSRR